MPQEDQERQCQCKQHSTLSPFAFKDYDEGNHNQDSDDHVAYDDHDDEEDDEHVEETSKDNEEFFLSNNRTNESSNLLKKIIMIVIIITTSTMLLCNRCLPRFIDMLKLGHSSFSSLTKHVILR